MYSDIIRKFGLIYAGGALAIEGVGVPWKRAELLDAIVKCCKAALETLSTEQRVLHSGWQSLKTRLMGLPRKPMIKRSEYDSIDGYVEQQQRRYRCIVKTDKFNRIFVNALQRRIDSTQLDYSVEIKRDPGTIHLAGRHSKAFIRNQLGSRSLTSSAT